MKILIKNPLTQRWLDIGQLITCGLDMAAPIIDVTDLTLYRPERDEGLIHFRFAWIPSEAILSIIKKTKRKAKPLDWQIQIDGDVWKFKANILGLPTIHETTPLREWEISLLITGVIQELRRQP